MTKAVVWVKKDNVGLRGLCIYHDGYPDVLGEILLQCEDEAEAEKELSEMVEDEIECCGLEADNYWNRFVSYFYIFKNGEWYVYKDDPKTMIPVKNAIDDGWE